MILPAVQQCQKYNTSHVWTNNYNDVIMSAMASQITGVSNVYSTACSGTDQRKHQSSASLDFVRGIHRWPVNSLHKGPVKRKCFHLMKIFPCHDVIMFQSSEIIVSPYDTDRWNIHNKFTALVRSSRLTTKWYQLSAYEPSFYIRLVASPG